MALHHVFTKEERMCCTSCDDAGNTVTLEHYAEVHASHGNETRKIKNGRVKPNNSHGSTAKGARAHVNMGAIYQLRGLGYPQWLQKDANGKYIYHSTPRGIYELSREKFPDNAPIKN
eukprot:226878_1